MRHATKNLAFVLLAHCAGFAFAADVNVGVSVSGQVSPGVYGRIDIGNMAPPPLVYAQPMVIVQQPRPVAPVYMHVPPGHAKNWGKHCHKYGACAQPVYFVKSAEYSRGGNSGGGKHKPVKHDYDHDGGHGKGHGHGNGKGHGKGHGNH